MDVGEVEDGDGVVGVRLLRRLVYHCKVLIVFREVLHLVRGGSKDLWM